MIRTEPYSETLVRTWSDAGMKIKQDGTGVIYDEAIDPISMGRTYTETDEPIEEPEDDLQAWAEAGKIFMGYSEGDGQ